MRSVSVERLFWKSVSVDRGALAESHLFSVNAVAARVIQGRVGMGKNVPRQPWRWWSLQEQRGKWGNSSGHSESESWRNKPWFAGPSGDGCSATLWGRDFQQHARQKQFRKVLKAAFVEYPAVESDVASRLLNVSNGRHTSIGQPQSSTGAEA